MLPTSPLLQLELVDLVLGLQPRLLLGNLENEFSHQISFTIKILLKPNDEVTDTVHGKKIASKQQKKNGRYLEQPQPSRFGT